MTALTTTTGRSERTPAKHRMLDRFVGQEVGALNAVQHWANPPRKALWLDLTAGDGVGSVESDWERSCSPGILARHAAQSAVPVDVVLYERAPATFQMLAVNLDDHLPALGWQRVADTTWRNGAHSFDVRLGNSLDATIVISPRTAVMALNDPNLVTDWAMAPDLLARVMRAKFARIFNTLGCNVGGLKRLDAAERAAWFDHLRRIEQLMPDRLDLMLAAIDRDAAQWAYAIVTSIRWRTRASAEFRSALASIGREGTVAWYRDNPDDYVDLCRRLFLTKAELASA